MKRKEWWFQIEKKTFGQKKTSAYKGLNLHDASNYHFVSQKTHLIFSYMRGNKNNLHETIVKIDSYLQ